MSKCCSWLSRPGCCRRQPQHAYIYLYSPTMADSSSSSHWCLVCILFGLCLAFVVILAAVVIYHLNSSNLFLPTTTTTCIDPCPTPIAKRLQLPDFVSLNIDPCKYFYNFACNKLTPKNATEKFPYDENKPEQKWTHIRHKFHDQIMSTINNKSTNKTFLL